jgi:NAD(P)-dependent dehydrogenase (short-subunit alcohol dehydrogenase family)
MQDNNEVKNKIILITGSTSGIGKATALELVKHSTTLILPVRNLTKGNELKKELNNINSKCKIELVECDLDSLESMQSFAKTILKKFDHIDILINNAGIMERQTNFTKDNIEQHFEVNVLSQYIFNSLLSPLLIKSTQGRIINVSSLLHKAGKLDLNNLNGLKTDGTFKAGFSIYSDTNVMRNLLTVYFADLLKKTKVTANCLHPGVIASNLGNQSKTGLLKLYYYFLGFFQKTVEEGALTTLHLALSKEGGEISGNYYAKSKLANASALSMDLRLAKQLAQKCKEITGI